MPTRTNLINLRKNFATQTKKSYEKKIQGQINRIKESVEYRQSRKHGIY